MKYVVYDMERNASSFNVLIHALNPTMINNNQSELHGESFVFLHFSNDKYFEKIIEKYPKNHVMAYSGASGLSWKLTPDNARYFSIIPVSVLDSNDVCDELKKLNTPDEVHNKIVELIGIKAAAQNYIDLITPYLLIGDDISKRFNSEWKTLCDLTGYIGEPDVDKIHEIARRYL